MKELIDLLKEITQDSDFYLCVIECDEQAYRPKADEYFFEFDSIYSRIGRHRYSDISKYIASILPDAVDGLCVAIKCIIESAVANDYDKDDETSKNNICYRKICKLYDHIELEAARYASTKKIQLLADNHSTQVKQVENLIKSANKSVSNAKEQAKRLSEQLISILGIFSGLIVTFSFATTIAGQTVAKLSTSEVIYTLFVICVLGLVFLNVIAFLMSFVAKLSGHEFLKSFPWAIYIISTLLFLGMIWYLNTKVV